jgi:predicted permease
MLTWQGQPFRSLISHPELQDLNASSRAFVGWGGSRNGTMNISDSRALPEQARGSWITANVFGLIGQAPLFGRDFTAADERKGAEPVAIISYTFWQRRYDGDPNVLGTSIRINSQPATIVGVMARGMLFPDNTEVWTPEIPDQAKEQRDARILDVFGLLRPESSLEEGRAETNGVLEQFAAAYPDQYKNIKTARVETFTDRYIGGAAKVMFWTMMGAVGFILLIACANVANLLLSRSAARAREVAVRSALGATRWRIVRQLLVESLVLAFVGGACGLVLTYTGVHLFDSAINDPGKPWWLDFRVDARVLAYVALICILTAVVFGLAPALHVSKAGAGQGLKEGGRGAVGNRRARWFTGSMVVTELALAVVLLAGAGLMIRSFLNLERLNLGFSPDHLITMRLQLPDQKYDSPQSRVAFYDRLLPKLGAVPGVESVAVATTMPPFRAFGRTFEIEGRPVPRDEDEQLRAPVVTITPAFFDVLGRGVLRGRQFGDGDGSPGSETVIVNERFALKFFPGEDPIGRRIRLLEGNSKPGSTAPAWRTIVAIGPPIRQAETRQIENDPVIYTPLRQDAPAGASLVARSQLPPASLVDVLRRAVQEVDADQPLFTIQTLDQMMDEERWPFRLFGATFGIFGLIGLALASVGLYAVMAYAVTQRTSEIGVRMALGAQPKDVRWMVLRVGLIQLAVGLSLGLAGAYLLSTVMERALVGITASDPATFAGITVILTVVALAACLIPARRATRIDPLVALREA